MYHKLKTEQGDNWSITVFFCLIDQLTVVLPTLWDTLEQNNEIAWIPHYTIRGSIPDVQFQPKTAIISWRVFREKENFTKINEIITVKLAEFKITPLEGQLFMDYHKWYLAGQVRKIWTRERCEILHQISKTAILLMKHGLFNIPSEETFC